MDILGECLVEPDYDPVLVNYYRRCGELVQGIPLGEVQLCLHLRHKAVEIVLGSPEKHEVCDGNSRCDPKHYPEPDLIIGEYAIC